ncbi:hypothetical protein LR48_Vigan11g007200 [Vigna angularis]|uniref:Uncharacterized protein n=1 Tax=Phaseolus angularis TaxID=3914 RepID=A0A0L9VPR5_PHAAN|nr:hypothetical protein LR48_Vigan11g007200 [Vigna angularis]
MAAVIRDQPAVRRRGQLRKSPATSLPVTPPRASHFLFHAHRRRTLTRPPYLCHSPLPAAAFKPVQPPRRTPPQSKVSPAIQLTTETIAGRAGRCFYCREAPGQLACMRVAAPVSGSCKGGEFLPGPGGECVVHVRGSERIWRMGSRTLKTYIIEPERLSKHYDRTVEDEDERPNTTKSRTVKQCEGRTVTVWTSGHSNSGEGRTVSATVGRTERSRFGRAATVTVGKDERFQQQWGEPNGHGLDERPQ